MPNGCRSLCCSAGTGLNVDMALATSAVVELSLARRRGDPPAQLEKGQQALPTTVVIILPKTLSTIYTMQAMRGEDS